MISVKEARLLARKSQNQVCRELGIPNNVLRSWEYGDRTPPPYVQKMVVDKILEDVKYCEIRYESDFDLEHAKYKHGISCWVLDPDNIDAGLQFYWFMEVAETERISVELLWKIQRLLDMGYKIKIIR